jgi:hypothetical protein
MRAIVFLLSCLCVASFTATGAKDATENLFGF